MGNSTSGLGTNQGQNPGTPSGPPGPPFAAGSAVNGLSLNSTGQIVLGNDFTGFAGGPAELLNQREISTQGNRINLIFDDPGVPVFSITSFDGAEVRITDAVGGVAFFNQTGITMFDASSNSGSYGLNGATVSSGAGLNAGFAPGQIDVSEPAGYGLVMRAVNGFTGGDIIFNSPVSSDAVLLHGGAGLLEIMDFTRVPKFDFDAAGFAGMNVYGSTAAFATITSGDISFNDTAVGGVSFASGVTRFGEIQGLANSTLVVVDDVLQQIRFETVGLGTLGRFDVTTGFTIFNIDFTVMAPLGRAAFVQNSSLLVAFGDVDNISTGCNILVNTPANSVEVNAGNGITISDALNMQNDTVMIHQVGPGWGNGAGAALGTLLNAPTAGNPTKWIPIDDAGVTRYIPCW